MLRLNRLAVAMALLALAMGTVASAADRAPDAQRGAQLYPVCAGCHGADAAGVAAGTTPRIAGQHYSVLLKQLTDFRDGRRADFRMGDRTDEHHFTDARDLADLAAYLSSLPPQGARGIGDGSHATAGALLFGKHCAVCHRADGSGDNARGVPRLAGQHYSYLVRQMYDAVDGRRSNLDSLHQSRLEPLSFEQVRGIADYLSRIEPAAAADARR